MSVSNFLCKAFKSLSLTLAAHPKLKPEGFCKDKVCSPDGWKILKHLSPFLDYMSSRPQQKKSLRKCYVITSTKNPRNRTASRCVYECCVVPAPYNSTCIKGFREEKKYTVLKVKLGKVVLSMPWGHIEGAEVQLRPFLTSALHGGYAAFTVDTVCIIFTLRHVLYILHDIFLNIFGNVVLCDRKIPTRIEI